MELPFQDVYEDTRDTRRVILAELERMERVIAACLRPGADPTFDWWGGAHRVDRERWLVLKADDVVTEDRLSVYGGEDRGMGSLDVVDVFSWLVAGTLAQHSGVPAATHVLNLVVVQPMVNPAAAPLFWVALNDMVQSTGPIDLMDVMRPMTFDMSRYPGSRADAPAVRAAQADYYRKWREVPPGWAALDDLAWADACTQLVAQAQCGIESHVFALIDRRAELIASAT